MPTVSSGGGAASGLFALFNSTLSGAAAAIDTGANGIAAGHGVLNIWLVLRTSEAGAISNALLTFNNDTGANYDTEAVNANNVTASATNAGAQTSVAIIVHGAGGTASYPSVARVTVPAYDATTFFKTGEVVATAQDGAAANMWVLARGFAWRSTAAITRVAITTASGTFAAGSQMIIYGTQ